MLIFHWIARRRQERKHLQVSSIKNPILFGSWSKICWTCSSSNIRPKSIIKSYQLCNFKKKSKLISKFQLSFSYRLLSPINNYLIIMTSKRTKIFVRNLIFFSGALFGIILKPSQLSIKLFCIVVGTSMLINVKGCFPIFHPLRSIRSLKHFWLMAAISELWILSWNSQITMRKLLHIRVWQNWYNSERTYWMILTNTILKKMGKLVSWSSMQKFRYRSFDS